MYIGTSQVSRDREGDKSENTFYRDRKPDDPYKEQAAKGQLLTISDSFKYVCMYLRVSSWASSRMPHIVDYQRHLQDSRVSLGYIYICTYSTCIHTCI